MPETITVNPTANKILVVDKSYEPMLVSVGFRRATLQEVALAYKEQLKFIQDLHINQGEVETSQIGISGMGQGYCRIKENGEFEQITRPEWSRLNHQDKAYIISGDGIVAVSAQEGSYENKLYIDAKNGPSEFNRVALTISENKLEMLRQENGATAQADI
jgi:hypothetical protein